MTGAGPQERSRQRGMGLDWISPDLSVWGAGDSGSRGSWRPRHGCGLGSGRKGGGGVGPCVVL